MMLLKVKNLKKIYATRFGGQKIEALKNVNLEVENGEYVAIMGESGSGKTTLLNMLAALDKPTNGQIILNGRNIVDISDKDISAFRREHLGFVFQDYNLLDTMTLQDNIALPLSLNGVSSKECIQKTNELAEMFGLREHLKKYPYQLSGGQKQRGATCRALITDPEIIFADEPTGALDSKSSHDLLECLKLVNDNDQATILMVTHDAFSASYAKEVYILSDGAIKCKLTKGQNQKEFYDRIIEMQASMGSDFS